MNDLNRSKKIMKPVLLTFALLVILSGIGMSDVVPSVSIPLGKLLDTKPLNEHRKSSPALDNLLGELDSSYSEEPDKTQMSIICREFLSDNGGRYPMPPEPHIVGQGNRWSEDGRFVRIYEAYTNTDSRLIDGRKQAVHTFLLTIDYHWHRGRGILLVPFWVVLDRTNPRTPTIKHWGVDAKKVSHIEQGEQAEAPGR